MIIAARLIAAGYGSATLASAALAATAIIDPLGAVATVWVGGTAATFAVSGAWFALAGMAPVHAPAKARPASAKAPDAIAGAGVLPARRAQAGRPIDRRGPPPCCANPTPWCAPRPGRASMPGLAVQPPVARAIRR